MKKLKGLIVGMLLCSSLVSVGSSFAATPKKVSPKVVTQTKDTFVVKNSQIELGTKWSAENNFEKATDTDGKALTWEKISKDVKVNGEVDTEKIGTYEVVYEYAKKKQTAKIEVIEAKKEKTKEKEVKPVENGIKEIKSKNITIPQGSKFEPSSVFLEAIKTNGEVASWQEIVEKIEVTDSVDTTKVGTYQVTYTLGEVTTTSEVTVVAVPTEIKLKPVTIEIGDTWNPVDSFDSVVMSDGSKLDWKAVSSEMVITGDGGSNVLGEIVNTKKAGTYKVSYLYQGQTATTTVTVKEKAVLVTVKKIELKDTTIEVGSKWEASQNFVKVVMSDDTELAWKDVSSEMTVTGNTGTGVAGEVVNTAKAGAYKVNYLYKGETATATVTVKEKAVPVTVKKIELKDTTITVGSTWEASQNFVKVTMSDGKELAWKDVSSEMTVTGNTGTGVSGQVVNTTKAGTYTASYLYKGTTATAKITVVEKKKQLVPVNKKVLPQTGENLGIGTVISGLLLLTGVFLTISLKMKKVEDN